MATKQIIQLPNATAYNEATDVFAIQQNGVTAHISGSELGYVLDAELAATSGALIVISSGMSATALLHANAYTDAVSASLAASIGAIPVGNYMPVSGGTFTGAVVMKGISSPKGSGTGNAVFGLNAANNLTTGQLNTHIGDNAGFSNTGDGNTAIGYSALSTQPTNNTVAVGYAAGSASPASNSVFLGWRAGYSEPRDNTLIINNASTSASPASANALIYGEFDTGVVKINGANVVTSANISAYASSDATLRAEVGVVTGALQTQINGVSQSLSGYTTLAISSNMSANALVHANAYTDAVSASLGARPVADIFRTEVASISAGLAAADAAMSGALVTISANMSANALTQANSFTTTASGNIVSSFFNIVSRGSCTTGQAVDNTSPNIKFDTLAKNDASCYDITTGRYNVKYDGIYSVHACMSLDPITTQQISMKIYKSGTQIFQSYIRPNSTNGYQGAHPISSIVECISGDYLEIKGYCDSSKATINTFTYFSIGKV